MLSMKTQVWMKKMLIFILFFEIQSLGKKRARAEGVDNEEHQEAKKTKTSGNWMLFLLTLDIFLCWYIS